MLAVALVMSMDLNHIVIILVISWSGVPLVHSNYFIRNAHFLTFLSLHSSYPFDDSSGNFVQSGNLFINPNFYCRAISNKQMHILNGNIFDVRNLKFAHLNMRGLKSKRSELEYIFDRYKPDIFGVSEANISKHDNLDYDDTMYNFVPGYTYSHTETRLVVFVKKGLRFKVRHDIMSKLEIPCVWLELSIGGKVVTVINLYREHRMVGLQGENASTAALSAQYDRFSKFIKFWERSISVSEETWTLGDFNLDFGQLHSNDSQHFYKRKMLSLIEDRICSKGVVQLVKGKTWCRDDGSIQTAIDHIYTDSPRYTSVSNFKNSSSDHNMISVIRRGDSKLVRSQYRTSRNMSKFNKTDFLYILNNLDLDPILEVRSPEQQVQMLTAALEVAADLVCPFVSFEVKKHHTKWMTAELRELISSRDSWFKEFAMSRSMEAHANYRQLRNRVNHELAKAKKVFYKKATNGVKDAEEVWAKLNEVAGRNATYQEPITVVDNDGVELNDPGIIAAFFNNFFQEKVEKIIEDLPPPAVPPPDRAPEDLVFDFKTVNVKTVRKHIFSLSNSKATGHDGISNILVKAANPVIAPVLTRIVNNCIRQSIFPESWKVGKICVLYKKGEKTNPKNYRPITLLCSLSKVIEKVLFNQTLAHFTDNGLMDKRQYGFRPGRSCVHAVLDYVTAVLSGKEEADMNRVNALLVDLSAAFDLVSHETLLKKLRDYGFSRSALKLMASYLDDRWVFTEVENRQSKLIADKYGVPQGSILGPLLYVIYVINVSHLDDHIKIIYADDTSCLIRANDLDQLDAETNIAMNNLAGYFASAGLKLNNEKTQLLNHNRKVSKVVIDQAGNELESVKQAKLLGITVDSNLNFHAHIDQLVKDVEYRLWMFRKVAKVASLENRKIYAHGLLFSKFVFGVQVYAGTDATYFEKARVCYDRCVRATFGPNPDRLTTDQMRSSLGILSLENLVKMMDIQTFRKILHSGRPEHLHKHISFSTRNRSQERGIVKIGIIPKTEKFRRTFLFRAAKSWNELPRQFKSLSSFTFRKVLKKYLLGDYFLRPGQSRPELTTIDITLTTTTDPHPHLLDTITFI